MTTFKDIQMDRNDSLPAQHEKFLDHCIIAVAAILVVACALGMTRSLYLFPLATLVVSGFAGCGLLSLNVCQLARKKP